MDWTQVSLAIVALISTIIVTLAPIIVTAVINAHTARLIEVKTLADNNQDIANGIVAVVQNVYKTFTGGEKFHKAFEKLDAQLHLPAGQTQQLIEQAVSGLTLAWGEAWTKLGEPSTTPVPFNYPIPTNTHQDDADKDPV